MVSLGLEGTAGLLQVTTFMIQENIYHQLPGVGFGTHTKLSLKFRENSLSNTGRKVWGFRGVLGK